MLILGKHALERAGADDVVDAVPVHALCGLWGVVGVGLFADLDALGAGLGRVSQIGVQLLGASVAFGWSFGTAWVGLGLIDRWLPLRVSAAAESVGFAKLLNDPATTLEDRSQFVATIRRGGERMVDLIDQVLDVSSVESGRIEIEPGPCAGAELLVETIDRLGRDAESKGIGLGLVYDSPMPEQIVTDRKRLQQILLHLIGNAIKFTLEGGVRVGVSANEGPSDTPLSVEVRDSGIGIRPDRLDQIFEPFVQADSSTTRSFGGTGLGLTLCRQRVRCLGGELTVASELGRGSHFPVRVPCGSTEVAPRPSPARLPASDPELRPTAA